MEVSILVFLDSSLRPPNRLRLILTITSFNPCFSGFIFETATTTLSGGSLGRCFNPCFSGFIFETSENRLVDGRDIALFQSLFFWIHL